MSAVRIGFNSPTGEVFESRGGGQCHVLPHTVTFTPAYIGIVNDNSIRLPSSPSVVGDHRLYFREDSFDPVTRVRRGRFYERGSSSHIEFYVSPSANDVRNLPGLHSAQIEHFSGQLSKMRVHLGVASMSSVWKVLQAEPITTCEVLVTLKSASYLGVLPDLDESKIPETFRAHVVEKLNKLVDDFQVAAPSAIIELSRDAASAVMTTVLTEFELTKTPKDLSESANIYSDHCGQEKKVTHYNVAHCAKILANLHNQNKSVEQLKSEYRPMGESEAKIAVRCLDQMVRDLGWAK